jgi:hypothetical protein
MADMDNPPDAADGVELMTYAELGARRGIGRASAERLARRRKWKRIPGNDGVTKVAVPRDWATLAPGDNPEDIRTRRVDPVPALRAAVEELRHQLRREGDRADKAEARVERVEGIVRELQTSLDQATAEAETLRQAEAERAGQGRWARLRAAWRGH